MKKNARLATVALAFAGVAMAGGSGVANAYPPVPDESPSEPTAVLSSGPEDSPETGGTLPQTGGPGTTQILLIAGVAVAAGVAVTGIAARRREDGIEAA